MKILNVKGHDVKLDDDWFEMLKNVKWHMDGYDYAVRDTNSSNDARRLNRKLEYMHNIILNRRTDNWENVVCDHIDQDKLNNTRENLRIVSKSMNNHNRPAIKSNKFGYNGIHWCKRDKKFIVKISVECEYHKLGRYDSIEESIIARYWGEIIFIKDEKYRSIDGQLLHG